MTEQNPPIESEDSDNEPLSLLTEDKNRDILSEVDNSSLLLKTQPLFNKIYEKKKLWKKTEVIHDKIDTEHARSYADTDCITNGGTFTHMFISYILPPIRLDEPLLDVWLDAKSINQTGPISCILCFECFLNKNKLIMHYVLNHNKPFCGTCRYLLPDKQSWNKHWECHLPLRCSQCPDNFMDELSLRNHFNNFHQLAHCRMCSLVLPIGELFKKHLYTKHSVTINQNIDKDELWSLAYPNSWNFSCLLCTKENLQSSDFLRHFLYHHKFSLKTLSCLVNGKNLGFTVLGANISTFTQSAENEDGIPPDTNFYHPNEGSNGKESQESILPEVKKEVISDEETEDLAEDYKEIDNIEKQDQEDEVDQASEYNAAPHTFLEKWSGREDFDVTLAQFIIFSDQEMDYATNNIVEMNSSTVTANNFLSCEVYNLDSTSVSCSLCSSNVTFSSLTHLSDHIVKQHALKGTPNYVCRTCLLNCQTHQELVKHNDSERVLFDNLYLCQMCDEEFPSREDARIHLSSHWETLKSVECTSPQLGLKCRYCALLFWHELDREEHQCQVHYTTYKHHFFKCKTCDTIFSDKIWWAAHEMKEHPEDDTVSKTEISKTWMAYKCVVCSKVYRQLDSLRTHFMEQHPDAKRLYCTVSGCISHPFRIPRYLKRHHEVIHRSGTVDPGLVNLRCLDCGKQMSTARAATTHRTVAHGDKSASRFKCRICGLGLPSMQDRKLHYLVVHPNVPAFSCTVCGKGYNNKSALYSHRTQSHAVNIVTYTCSYCSKIFNKRDSYKEHLLIHVGPRHACPHCSRVFVQRSNMLRHIRLHTGEKPYPCLHCEKTFSDKGACNSHMRTHSKQDAYPCSFCGQKFLQKQKLKYHMRKHTGEDLETCGICSKKFTNLTNLREHMKTHDDSSPATCLHCGKSFMSKRYMERHIRDSHSNTAEVHPCPLCGRACPRLSALRHHLLTHSSVKHITCLVCGKSYNGKKSINRHLMKRHRIQVTDERYKTSYHQLDPRQCGLGLDEETFLRVFGPQKDIKPILPFQFTNVNNSTPKNKTKPPRPQVQNDGLDEEESDQEYRPMRKIKVESEDQNTNEGDVPISGLELASLKSRVRRETAKAVNYAFDSDDDGDKPFGKMTKKKSKAKFKKKLKTKDTRNNFNNGVSQEQYEIEVPLFPMVEIKTEPVDYD